MATKLGAIRKPARKRPNDVELVRALLKRATARNTDTRTSAVLVMSATVLVDEIAAAVPRQVPFRTLSRLMEELTQANALVAAMRRPPTGSA
jgi:hypothetical protein